jgi:hypothetical protein
LAKGIEDVGSVAHQPAGFGIDTRSPWPWRSAHGVIPPDHFENESNAPLDHPARGHSPDEVRRIKALADLLWPRPKGRPCTDRVTSTLLRSLDGDAVGEHNDKRGRPEYRVVLVSAAFAELCACSANAGQEMSWHVKLRRSGAGIARRKMGVGEDFATFKDSYNISTELISSISYRYKRITRQLNTDFWNTNSETAHSLYVGSYGRDTDAKGISDLDIAFELPNAEYHKYNRHEGNGQSALLQAVKRSMQRTYSTSDTSSDGQVVVINFDDKIKFEVLPVFENEDRESFTFPNANGGGSWRTCNPRAEIAAISKRSDATNRNLKYLCRMMRVWSDYCAVPMSGIADRHAGVSVHRKLPISRQIFPVSRLYGAGLFRLFVEARSKAECLAGARQQFVRQPHRCLRA